MKKYSIGYRLKFDYIDPEDIKEYVTNYLKLFDRYEIKITENLISSGKIELLLDVSEELANGKYSMHIFKDVINNPETYRVTLKLIEMLRRFDVSNEVYLVTHIPYENLSDYLSKVLIISKLLPQNYILLLENIVLYSNNTEYLEQINNICKTLEANNITNIGICLDIGHLLHGCNKENISESSILSRVQKMEHFLSRVKELHIHDYQEQDHLQLGSGSINLKLVSDFIKESKLNVPTIIETTVKVPEQDGIKQITIMEELLSTS